MQKLWRRELVKGPFLYNNIASGAYFSDADKKSEAQYVEQISQAIKMFKKKQDLYFKIVQTLDKKRIEKTNPDEPLSQDFLDLKQQHENNIKQEIAIILRLKSFQGQSFSQSKTYLYTVFMRIVQILEISKQRVKIQYKNVHFISKDSFQQQKSKMHEVYNNSACLNKFDIVQILESAKKLQNDRINRFFPKKKVPYHKPPPPVYQNERIKSLQSRQIRRKNSSKLFQAKVDLLISKKLIGSANNREKSEIRSKKKPTPKINQFNLLYKILGVKNIKIEDFQLNKWEINDQMMERNERIREERRKWEKQYQCSVKGFRTKIKSKN